METRLIVAYAIIFLMALAFAGLIFHLRRSHRANRRVRHRGVRRRREARTEAARASGEA